ncbi:espin isoform X2 [Cimex lectularius]|nr:espin isoform X2 [Cimex lectularius]XP_014241500.1 espin isoform X2 [Cimex lectularius]XP_024082717.1 espin isoform X2 [Cimex lectularius]
MPSLEPNPNGALALHYAAARGCLDCARLLVDTSTGLTANTQMENDVTPVYLAAQEGHLEVLRFLVLEAGGSLYIRAKDGMAPVHAAAQMGSLTCLKWMIEDQGVDPNLRDGDGATPLHFAASRGHVDCVKWLLRHGALLLQDNYGKSPINDAAENQQMQCLNELVQHGTSPDYSEDARRYGRFHGCTCRIADPTNRCSYADCVNYSTPHEPFYLHTTKENAYMTPIGSTGQDPFYLHKPGQFSTGYHRVRELFGITLNSTSRIELPQTPPPPPPSQPSPQSQGNRTTVRVEVHHNGDEKEEDDVSAAGTDVTLEPETVPLESLPAAPMPPSTPPIVVATELPPLPPQIEQEDEGRGSTIIEEHDYEDIYSVKGRDSGSHSRSPSMSSAQSDTPVVITATNDSSESGVSSPSPSELGSKSESEEPEKAKLELRHSLPHQTSQNSRSLKRVVSVPLGISPPPPPPPPPSEDSSLTGIPSLPPQSQQPPTPPQQEAQTQPNAQNNGDGMPGGQIGHLVNKQMVLPFIPPKFGEGHDPEALIKPSEYLKSLQGGAPPPAAQSAQQTPAVQHTASEDAAPPPPAPGPPPPPPPPPPHQPLSTISIQDITSVQLKRTKNPAVKTMSCPHPSLPGTVESPFQHAKEDLIAELKLSKDISGIKKLKVERVKMEEKQEKEIASTISKKFTVDSFVEKVPDKDSAGNPIPAWKRQMLAKKAAEKARKEMEEELAKEAELKRLQAIPAWKRHLLQKKVPQTNSCTHEETKPTPVPENKENKLPEVKPLEKKDDRDDEVAQIIPWRAQLRKTNSTLNLLE